MKFSQNYEPDAHIYLGQLLEYADKNALPNSTLITVNSDASPLQIRGLEYRENTNIIKLRTDCGDYQRVNLATLREAQRAFKCDVNDFTRLSFHNEKHEINICSVHVRLPWFRKVDEARNSLLDNDFTPPDSLFQLSFDEPKFARSTLSGALCFDVPTCRAYYNALIDKEHNANIVKFYREKLRLLTLKPPFNECRVCDVESDAGVYLRRMIIKERERMINAGCYVPQI